MYSVKANVDVAFCLTHLRDYWTITSSTALILIVSFFCLFCFIMYLRSASTFGDVILNHVRTLLMVYSCGVTSLLFIVRVKP